MESLIEPFRRLGGRSQLANGVGLGLAIVRAVATAHRGRVAARSRSSGGLVARGLSNNEIAETLYMRRAPRPPVPTSAAS